MCYAFYLLSRNPDVLEKIRAEHDSVFGKDRNKAASVLSEEPRLINQVPYTTAVIKEALRMFPPSSTMREGSPDCSIVGPDGSKYPTDGTLIWVVHQSLHRNPAYWVRPDDFIPERWLVGPDDTLHPVKDAWRPFEFGPRNCLGQELAMLEVKAVLKHSREKSNSTKFRKTSHLKMDHHDNQSPEAAKQISINKILTSKVTKIFTVFRQNPSLLGCISLDAFATKNINHAWRFWTSSRYAALVRKPGHTTETVPCSSVKSACHRRRSIITIVPVLAPLSIISLPTTPPSAPAICTNLETTSHHRKEVSFMSQGVQQKYNTETNITTIKPALDLPPRYHLLRVSTCTNPEIMSHQQEASLHKSQTSKKRKKERNGASASSACFSLLFASVRISAFIILIFFARPPVRPSVHGSCHFIPSKQK
jgi:Cytochrome P450